MKRRALLDSLILCCGVLLLGNVAVLADDKDWGAGWRPITGPGGVPPLPRDLSIEEAQHMVEHYVAWEFNGRLKLGKIHVRDADTFIVDLTTLDGYLVQRLDVNRHTGYVRPTR